MSYKGILIDESVSNPEKVLGKSRVQGTRKTTLEGEDFRGDVTFYNIEVSDDNLSSVLTEVADSIKKPGWYFHLVNPEKLYIVMPNAILSASNNDEEIAQIVEYATSQGIHPEQLNLKQLFDNPYA